MEMHRIACTHRLLILYRASLYLTFLLVGTTLVLLQVSLFPFSWIFNLLCFFSFCECVCVIWFFIFIFLDTGKVFTCGDGSFGQLGHGDYQSQNLPREIMDLGSKFVEQIACGMRHTLVLLEGAYLICFLEVLMVYLLCGWKSHDHYCTGHLKEQIYGFGSGKRGQLSVGMDNVKRLCNIPQIIYGFEDNEIASIAANGDQSAALTGNSRQ